SRVPHPLTNYAPSSASNQAEPRLLQSKLRHRRPRYPLPKSYLPPDLAPRLSHLGRLFWIFLYFLRDEPLVVFNRQSDDRTVMICLSVLTVVMLLFTHATANVLGAMLTAVVLVLVHAAVRRSDNLFLDEEAVAASEYSGLTSYPSS
ncbi:unnamed protein product, partial [Brassica napus]